MIGRGNGLDYNRNFICGFLLIPDQSHDICSMRQKRNSRRKTTKGIQNNQYLNHDFISFFIFKDLLFNLSLTSILKRIFYTWIINRSSERRWFCFYLHIFMGKKQINILFKNNIVKYVFFSYRCIGNIFIF